MASLLGARKRKMDKLQLESRIANDGQKIKIRLKLPIQKINKDKFMLVG